MRSPIPPRSAVPASDQWDLSSYFSSELAWEEAFQHFKTALPSLAAFEGRLGGDLQVLCDFLARWMQLEQQAERLSTYAFLRNAENLADSEHTGRLARFQSSQTELKRLTSFVEPELVKISEAQWATWIEDGRLKEYRILLERIRRHRDHILSPEGETLLALASDTLGTLRETFQRLTNTDLQFGHLETPEGSKPLTQSTFTVFLQSSDASLRRRAYSQFYGEFLAHENTLASLYAGSVKQDIFLARARGFSSSRERALFPDAVPEAVYDTLVGQIRQHLPLLHRYYALRARLLGLERLHHSDVYAPLVKQESWHCSYSEAVDLVCKAVQPLGAAYGDTLRKGLTTGWVDRYENQGKRSGAFSSGAYGCDPVILMNYKSDNLRDLFTLAHEAGHSMHTYFSQTSQPFAHYSYSIFEAEVASTFNEHLLLDYLLQHSPAPSRQAWLLGKSLEDFVATVFRQTMFAEFEMEAHQRLESGLSLTSQDIRDLYGRLLRDYFGPQVVFEDYSALEALRIPHFYGAFYVYKYATGLAASLALSRSVLEGGEHEREKYLNFLKRGASLDPLENLAEAGVDMSRPQPLEQALKEFMKRLEALELLTA